MISAIVWCIMDEISVQPEQFRFVKGVVCRIFVPKGSRQVRRGNDHELPEEKMDLPDRIFTVCGIEYGTFVVLHRGSKTVWVSSAEHLADPSIFLVQPVHGRSSPGCLLSKAESGQPEHRCVDQRDERECILHGNRRKDERTRSCLCTCYRGYQEIQPD